MRMRGRESACGNEYSLRRYIAASGCANWLYSAASLEDHGAGSGSCYILWGVCFNVALANWSIVTAMCTLVVLFCCLHLGAFIVLYSVSSLEDHTAGSGDYWVLWGMCLMLLWKVEVLLVRHPSPFPQRTDTIWAPNYPLIS